MGTPTQKWLRALVRKAASYQRIAVTQNDEKLLWDLFNFAMAVIQVAQLLEAFRTANYKIDGGVTSALKLSRNAVYCRLKLAGLDPEDFKRPDATVAILLRKSAFKPLISRIERLPSPSKRARSLVGGRR